MVGFQAHVSARTTEQWERELGSQIRRSRLADNLSQADFADAANVSLSAIKALEAGRGSSLRTLIRAVRVLGKTQWLESLSPDPGVDPLALADAMRKSVSRTRASKRAGG